MTRTIEGIIASAYPDVRVGREFEEEPEACPWPLAEPGYVMRFRKRRSFIHPLGHPTQTSAAARGRTTPLTEAIAMTQVAVGAPSLVRLQLTPASEQLEDRARRGLERHERRRAGGRHADRPARAGSTLEQAEMHSAVEVRHGSMFYLEVRSARPTGRRATASPRASWTAEARTICTAATWWPANASTDGGSRPLTRRCCRRCRCGRWCPPANWAPVPAALGADEERAGSAADDPADAGAARRVPRDRPRGTRRRAPHRIKEGGAAGRGSAVPTGRT